MLRFKPAKNVLSDTLIPIAAILDDTYRVPFISQARELDTPESNLDKLADEVRQDPAPK
jgi:hypothetical protein